jgi:flagellin-like protein
VRQEGLSPIIATILLIGITITAATPVVWWLATYYAPFRPRFIDLAVYAGLVNENIVRFHIQHIAGESVRFDPEKPTTERIQGWAFDPGTGLENMFYCWTFENPLRFRQSDWAYAEVQLRGAELEVGEEIEVRVALLGVGLLYDGDITINYLDQIPGG